MLIGCRLGERGWAGEEVGAREEKKDRRKGTRVQSSNQLESIYGLLSPFSARTTTFPFLDSTMAAGFNWGEPPLDCFSPHSPVSSPGQKRWLWDDLGLQLLQG